MFITISTGSWLVLASQVFAVIIHSLAKFLETTGDVEPLQILQVRMFITLGLNSLSLLAWSPLELPLGSCSIGGLLATRVLGGICGSFGFYYSLRYLSLGDATVINLLAPLGSSLLLSKRIDFTRIASVVICILGVGLITKPSFAMDLLSHVNETDQSDSRIGLIFAFTGVLGGVVHLYSCTKRGRVSTNSIS
ncbi:hypothetical protein COCC4DRAFT_155204 [Bipolaris maydis ATCC 48331]|uniref:EamA domain-containing protein n=2 Tax=Cochliobolus heterostrophus TaxID=5016 RepID=M2UTS4_COCH5|nr:uncharacterized protein COCC4DRAFT_155204 [Bipolaris maydis ATCC 48331]EMD84694.1 hypothetical protein COCHEDRAFT_1161949 [Bipolaris maydis C5]KAJ5027017.1 hypothetical protein J3E73DRAFT_300619 [Bipolaris maydis]EMD91262.1 hypothetical protein COCHEDRAFT_1155656 [Bipolaris maydis C5]ENH98670.1 hypothetical protein COCC4DRAFT_155204 [Bipolaris maydis ATCC 48331]KAJ6271084.1 hypothetical protein PSV08DRAFT_301641 [Bipolaris maydis]